MLIWVLRKLMIPFISIKANPLTAIKQMIKKASSLMSLPIVNIGACKGTEISEAIGIGY